MHQIFLLVLFLRLYFHFFFSFSPATTGSGHCREQFFAQPREPTQHRLVDGRGEHGDREARVGVWRIALQTFNALS